jgi:hypothetical protein
MPVYIDAGLVALLRKVRAKALQLVTTGTTVAQNCWRQALHG